MKHGFFRHVAAAFFALSLGAGAAEPAQPLPEEVSAHVSVANPRRFLDGAFRYVGASTKGTANYVPAEMVGMLANAYAPVPFSAWDAEGELNVVALGSFPTITLVAVFSIESFENLVAGLEDANWTVLGELGAEAPFAAGRPVALPNGRPMFLADLGDGRAVLADNLDDAGKILSNPDWSPAHRSGADLVARVRLAGDDAWISHKILAGIAAKEEEMVKTVADAGLTGATGLWMVDMAKKYGETVGDEIELAEVLDIELDFEGDTLVLGLAALFADGSWMRKWAETLEAAEAFPDAGLTARLPKGAFTIAANGPFAALVPGAEAINESFMTDLAALAPERKDGLAGIGKALFAAKPGASAAASYFNGGRPYQVSITKFDDAGAALDAALRFGDALGGIAAKSFVNPAECVSFPAEKQTDGEREWHSWKLEPADAEQFAAFVDRLESMDRRGELTIEPDPDFRVYMAELPGSEELVTLAGPVGQDEFSAVLKEIAESAADAAPPLDAPAAKRAAEALGSAQLTFGLVNPDDAYLAVLLRRIQREGRSGALSEEIIERFAAEARTVDADAAFGVGAMNGRVAARVAAPAATVSAIIRKHEQFMKAAREAAKKAAEEADEEAAGGEAPEGAAPSGSGE